MGLVKYPNNVFRLKHGGDYEIPKLGKMTFNNGQEFHIVIDVLYMSGHPVPGNLQIPIISWIEDNSILFVRDTRNF